MLAVDLGKSQSVGHDDHERAGHRVRDSGTKGKEEAIVRVARVPEQITDSSLLLPTGMGWDELIISFNDDDMS